MSQKDIIDCHLSSNTFFRYKVHDEQEKHKDSKSNTYIIDISEEVNVSSVGIKIDR
jgi:hypothetical protein